MIEAEWTEIEVRGLTVFAHHGVWLEERKLGQKFILTLKVWAALGLAVAEDSYSQAVCYGTLCRIAEQVACQQQFALIETLADRVACAILDGCGPVQQVEVTVSKPGAPLPHALEAVKVRVKHRRRHAFGLGLGGNLSMADEKRGPGAGVEDMLRLALERLARAPGMEIERVSSLYDSVPWGGVDQPPFVNCVALGVTTLTPEALLGLCKETEEALGRQAGARWGARAVDIDVLFYGDQGAENRTHAALTLPHKHLFERAFVLAPLAELDAGLVIGGRTVGEALAALPRVQGDAVRRPTPEGMPPS